jgi:hypothetical protein
MGGAAASTPARAPSHGRVPKQRSAAGSWQHGVIEVRFLLTQLARALPRHLPWEVGAALC